jgi:hypothetical protein
VTLSLIAFAASGRLIVNRKRAPDRSERNSDSSPIIFPPPKRLGFDLRRHDDVAAALVTQP